MYRWTHTDPRGIGALAAAAMRATDGRWSASAGGREGDWRAWLAGNAYVIAGLAGTAELDLSAGELRLHPDLGRPNVSPERQEAAAILARGLLVACGNPPRDELAKTPNRLSTDASGPALATSAPPEAAGVPALLAIVVVGVGVTVVLCYGAYQAAQVIDRKLSRDGDTQRMVANQTARLGALKLHLDAEAAAGRELPLSAAEKDALRALDQAQKSILEKREEPLPALPPGSAPVLALGGFGLGALLAAGVGLWLLTSKG